MTIERDVAMAMRGDIYVSGVLKVPANSNSVTLYSDRIGSGKCILLSPLDNQSATLTWWIDESTLKIGEVVIRFSSSASGECTFRFCIIGMKEREVID